MPIPVFQYLLANPLEPSEHEVPLLERCLGVLSRPRRVRHAWMGRDHLVQCWLVGHLVYRKILLFGSPIKLTGVALLSFHRGLL